MKKMCERQFACAILFLCVIFSMAGCKSESNTSGLSGGEELPTIASKVTMIKPTGTAAEWYGVSYDSVVSELRSAGFSQIQVEPEEDLTSAEAQKDGTVKSIAINGDSTFTKDTEFPEDAQVVIVYHTIIKAAIPISSTDIQDYDSVTLQTMFSDAGFINIKVEEIFDLDPDEINVEYINDLCIDELSEFKQNDIFPYDTEISIICHRPYEKFTVDVHLDFLANLIFNRYGLVIYLDDEELQSLAHGEDADISFRVKAGTYTITFLSTDSSNLKKKLSIDVSSDIEAEYSLSCYRDRIEVNEKYFDRKVELAENEAKVPASASEYKYDNYETVVNELKEAGFTNIKTNVLYDIYWGWTDEGEVDSVTIDGNGAFTRGDIFASDAEVVVVYHMPEDDDPTRISVPNGSSYYVGMNYKEVEQIFKNLGFSNISVSSFTTEDTSYEDEEVRSVKINSWKFSQGETFEPDDYVMISYYIVEEPVYISMPEGTSAYIGMDYQEVAQIFKSLGFTDVDVEEETTSNSSWSDGEVYSVTADYGTFEQGEEFEQDDRICVKYYVYEAPTPVFYSTNDYDTATKGNTGIFSYKNKGGSYDVYWIIDFDEGYVYFFTDGNGESYCDKVKIVSGDLNDRITITWNDDSDEESWYLHFKYKNNPVTLIVVDHFGSSVEFTTTDLGDALSLRNSKTIIDY